MKSRLATNYSISRHPGSERLRFIYKGLEPQHYRCFILRVSLNGEVKLGRAGVKLRVLYCRPKPVKYLSQMLTNFL